MQYYYSTVPDNAKQLHIIPDFIRNIISIAPVHSTDHLHHVLLHSSFHPSKSAGI